VKGQEAMGNSGGRIGRFRGRVGPGGFNITALIDVVFLLIIFFLVVCRFVEAENPGVAVPDGCKWAWDGRGRDEQGVTLTVIDDGGRVVFGVGGEWMRATGDEDMRGLAGRLARLIDGRMKDLDAWRRVVTLRIDKDVRYAEAQYALAAVAESTATDVRLAVVKGVVDNRE